MAEQRGRAEFENEAGSAILRPLCLYNHLDYLRLKLNRILTSKDPDTDPASAKFKKLRFQMIANSSNYKGPYSACKRFLIMIELH